MADIKIPEKYLDEAVERLMRGGHYSLEEATQIAIDDWRIDHGDRCEWEPTVEEEKAMRKATKLVGKADPRDKKTDARGKTKTKKEDPLKRELVAAFVAAAESYGVAELVVDNPERLFTFMVGDDTFTITLTKKRNK